MGEKNLIKFLLGYIFIVATLSIVTLLFFKVVYLMLLYVICSLVVAGFWKIDSHSAVLKQYRS